MAGFGLGGSANTSLSKKAARKPVYSPGGLYVQDMNGQRVTPGLTRPGSTDPWPKLYGNIPDTSTMGSRFVGVPQGSSLIMETNRGTITAPFNEQNTYEELERVMSGTATGGGKARGARENLTSLQRRLVALGLMSESAFKSMADWGNPAHEATRAAIASLMYQGNLTGESWQDVARGKGLSDKQQAALGVDTSGNGTGQTINNYITRQVDLSNRKDAKALLRATMQQYLGRSPQPSEVGEFVKALNRQEQANPAVTSQAVDEAGDTQTTDMTTSGGLNRDEFAAQFVQRNFAGEEAGYKSDSVELMILDAIGGM